MTRTDCPRLWEAEAIEDGRLRGKERASFERHASTCASCSRATDAIACLRAMAEKLPVPAPLAELEHRRQRAELLRRANEIAVAAPRKPRPRAIILAAALVTAGAIAAAGVVLHRAAPPAAVASVAEPTVYAVSPLPGASWRTVDGGADVRLALDAGTLSVHVAKLLHNQHFVIAMPDGELEVRGTRFTVAVAGGHTRRVAVTEGRVALRIHGDPERMLAAGESWGAEPVASAPQADQPPVAPVPVAQAAPDPAAAVPAPAVHGERVHAASAAPGAVTPAAPVAASTASAKPVVATPDTAATDLEAAMAAFKAGDFGRAEQLFATFQQHHPRDARCEDAAYLRSVARARAGDTKGAADLARSYLERYPGGLRRNEAEHLAQ